MSGWNARSEPVEAVLFDLGNTLVSYYKSSDFAPILERCVAAGAAVLDSARRARAPLDITAAYARALECNLERPDHRVWPLAERLAKVFALDAAEPALGDALATAFLAPIFATARLDPSAVDTLRAIKQLGVKTAIVSNTPWGSPAAPWRAELDRHGLLGVVDAAVFCVDVGWRKPARAPFAHALAMLGITPGRAWFVGDDATWDVAGARGAGMTPILIGASGLREDCAVIPEVAALLPLLTRVLSKR
jgi:putative hydrolase of the HAD superfamily